LRGPFGHKKWVLITRGVLRDDPAGSVLDVKMHLDRRYALFALGILIPFGCFLILLFSRSLLALCMLPMLTVLYGGILINIKFEAETIKELLSEILSVGGEDNA
jgi:hypothetical protein